MNRFSLLKINLLLFTTLCYGALSCLTNSDERKVNNILDDYPLNETSLSDKQRDLAQCIYEGDDKELYLKPGIYCAEISYNYGDYRVKEYVTNESISYSDGVDTIEVKVELRELGNEVSAFIFNNREDIWVVPKNNSTETIDGRTIYYRIVPYMLLDREKISSFDVSIDYEDHLLVNYNIKIFSKGGQCAADLSKNVPSIKDVIALNLKHNSLKAEAQSKYNEKEYEQSLKEERKELEEYGERLQHNPVSDDEEQRRVQEIKERHERYRDKLRY